MSLSRLMEWSAGAWSGELYSDLSERWPDEWAAWTADRYNQRAPNGESFVDLAERARSCIVLTDGIPTVDYFVGGDARQR